MSYPANQATDIMPDINTEKTSGSKPSRIPALDFTKGALVLIMVLYHWINYFHGPQDNRYLRFLTPSFIFISGFIISNIYVSKYGISDLRLLKRLIQRGLKILVVFLVLNLTRDFFVFGRSHGQASSVNLSVRSLVDVFLTGGDMRGGDAKLVAFFILVPISYLLVLSGLLLILSRFYRYTVHLACLFLLLCIVALSFAGLQIPNLELLAIGLLGVIAGYLPIDKVNAAVAHQYLLAAGCVVYLAAISVWNIIYPLQIMGVYLSLMILYLLGEERGEPGMTRRTIVLLGKYSLLGYISQIAILQLLRLGLNNVGSKVVVQCLSFLLAFALTIVTVQVVDHTRAKSTTIDRLYRAVFA